MAPTCKFFLQGNCRFGDNCRFEHPRANVVNHNPFNALQQNNEQGGRNTHSRNRYDNSNRYDGGRSGGKYQLDKEAIRKDLTTERPMWILSSYAPLRDLPAQLFGGAREQSYEELRVRHYEAAAAGNPQAAVQEAMELVQNAEQQTQNALNDLYGAIRFILAGEKEHPNRIDICNGASSITNAPANTAFGSQNNATPFGAPSNNTGTFGAPSAPSAFGQPSMSGAQSNPFGQPSAFGAPSQASSNNAGAFGQPASLGPKPSPFGAPATNASPFGQPSQPQANSSPFGAPSGTAFGAPQPAGNSPFGQPNNQGVASGGFPPQQNSPFGQPSGQSSNAFGQPSLGQSTNTFGQPAFGEPANPFGQPSAPTQQQPSAFGQPAAAPQANPFGQPSSQQSNPFGQPPGPQNNASGFPSSTSNAFGAQPPQGNPFGAPSNTNTNAQVGGFQSNVFGASQPMGQAPAGQVDANPYGPASTEQHPPTSSYIQRGMDGRLVSFKGRPVQYKNDVPGYRNPDGSWEKIWFPDGPPPYTKETEVDDNLYNDQVKSAYEHLRSTGSFPGSIIPLLPPRREWCLWDF